MGSTERREREKENLRLRIVEAARDLIAERGLDGLSMRAIAERIEYSPATIYLYFADKHALLRALMLEAFSLLDEYIKRGAAEAGEEATAAERHRFTGRAYARFALENTAYFRIMFELPGVPQIDCPEPAEGEVETFQYEVLLLQQAIQAGELAMSDPLEGAVISWGMIHGLTSLYLSGRLGGMVESSDDFMMLIESSMAALNAGWLPRPAGTPGSEPRTPARLVMPAPCAGAESARVPSAAAAEPADATVVAGS